MHNFLGRHASHSYFTLNSYTGVPAASRALVIPGLLLYPLNHITCQLRGLQIAYLLVYKDKTDYAVPKTLTEILLTSYESVCNRKPISLN